MKTQLFHYMKHMFYYFLKGSEEAIADQLQSVNISEPHLPVKKQSYDLDALHSAFDKAIKEDDWEQMDSLLDDAALLINTDTGGQTEFLELMSRFLLGSSSLNLIFTKLTYSLDDSYEIYSTDLCGLSSEKENSKVTVNDVLFQALASVASLKQSDYDSDEASSSNTEQCHISKPRALIVGTFRDKVSSEKVKELDKALQERIKVTNFYDDNMIVYPAEGQVILPVNNYSGQEEDICDKRKVLQDLMKKCFDKVSIPIHWLMLNLSIQNEQSPVLTYVKCKRLARKLKIDENELQNALRFLHDSIGTLFYYPEISDFFKNNIIRDIQVRYLLIDLYC